MTKYLIALFCACIVGLLSQLPANASWAHIQDAYFQNTGGGSVTSVAVTTGSSVTAGNLVVVSLATAGPAGSYSVADSAGNTYTQAAVGGTRQSYIFYSVIATGGPLTITATVPASSFPSITMAEYSFTPGTIYLASTGTFNVGSGTAISCTPSLGFYASSALAVCSAENGGTGTITAGSGFTVRETVGSVASQAQGIGFEDNVGVTSSNSPVTAAATLSAAASTAASAAVFQSTGDLPVSGWMGLQTNTKTNPSGSTTSISTALPNSVTVGNMVTVCVSTYAVAATATVSDSGSNTWTLASSQTGGALGTTSWIYYSIITTGGNLTFTTTCSPADYPSMAVTEYAFSPGTVSVANANNAVSTGTTPSAGNVTFTASKALVVANLTAGAAIVFTPGTGFIVGNSATHTASNMALRTEVYQNATSSPVTANGTLGSSTTVGMAAAAFQSSGDTGSASDSASPSTSANAQTVTYTITGTSTSWTSGTTFSISGVTGASITSQSCNAGTQVGTVAVLLDNTHTGTLTFTDSTDAASCTSAVTLAAPGAPTSPACSPGNAQNTISWSAPASGGAVASYNIYRGTTPGGESGTPLVTGATSPTVDGSLTNGTTYYYTVKAVNATGTSAASTEVSGTPQNISFSVSPSTHANAASVTYTLTGSNTSWTGGTTFSISGVTGASITSQSCNAGTQVGTVTILLDNTHTGTLSFTDSTDSAGATSAVTLAAPGVPASPSCSAGNTQNVLNWSAPASGGLVATYNVYRGTTPGGESGTAIVTGLTSPTYTNTGLTNGTTYYYTIKAVNATGTSAASTEVSGTPNTIAFTVVPTTVVNNQNVSYTLTGTGTAWTPTTVFSISGVSGARIISQAAQSSVLGAVTVSFDTFHTGTLTFSDSTDTQTATTAVTQYSVNSSIAISPTSINHATYGNNINITGTNVSWGGTNSKPGSPTFTVSSGTIIDQQVHTTKTATIIMTAPASAGSVTITDPSSGATATLTVN